MNKHQFIHFIGIGGYGMSGIAHVLLRLHYRISGSDLRRTDFTRNLERLGARIFDSHRAENMEDVQAVVVSSAIPYDNPEIRRANELNIPIMNRAEMLAFLMERGHGVAIAGTHGKTTTTSLISCILEHAGVDPTVIIGGEVSDFGGNSKLGFGPHVVVEADESDGSFLYLSPFAAVITNIDNDHMDYYRDSNHLRKTFSAFLDRLDPEGFAVVCTDCAEVRQILPHTSRELIRYGFEARYAEFTAGDVENCGLGVEFSVFRRSRAIGRIHLNIPGRHNVLNALAAVAVCLKFEIPFAKIAEACRNFQGVGRRFQTIGECEGIRIVDDYAHHPTEVLATLEAARNGGYKRTITVFQPHRFTRTRDFFKEFADALQGSDIVVIDNVYAASENPIQGISGQMIADELQKNGHLDVHFIPGRDQIQDYLVPLLKTNDLVLTVGAGDITSLGPSLLAKLKESRSGHVAA